MIQCMRQLGHSVALCACKTADGFLECPAETLGVLTPTYPPAAYKQAAAALRRAQSLGTVAGFNRGPAAPAAPTPEPVPPPRSAPRLVYSGGYTGSICDECGGVHMRRSGTCETCDDCGHAGGCG